MKKFLLLALISVTVTGCNLDKSEPYYEELNSYILPPELSHCKVFKVVGRDYGRVLYITTCSGTDIVNTYLPQKNPVSVTKIDN